MSKANPAALAGFDPLAADPRLWAEWETYARAEADHAKAEHAKAERRGARGRSRSASRRRR